MNSKLVVTISVLAAMPAFAQVQDPPKPTTEEIQRVVQTITADKTKTQQHCNINKLNEKMVQAEKRKDTKTLEALGKQADELAQKIGLEYVKLTDALDQLDQNSSESKEIVAALDALDKLCAKK